MGIKIGLVTSGLYEKAWPEILSAFKTLNMGDPKDFYDGIIAAGFPICKGDAGMLTFNNELFVESTNGME